MEKPVTWEKFTESFYEQFFLKTVRREMEQQFINLRQRSRTVDEYAAEFLRLSWFAPYMVQMKKTGLTNFSRA